ncbi:MAG: hypothetical protein ACRD2L_02445 [Terriglobia bacterium]
MKASKIGMVLALFIVALWFVPATSFAQANPCGLPMEKKPAAGEKKAEKGMDKDKGMKDKDKGMKDDKAAKGKQGAENPCAPMKK